LHKNASCHMIYILGGVWMNGSGCLYEFLIRMMCPDVCGRVQMCVDVCVHVRVLVCVTWLARVFDATHCVCNG